MVVLAGVMVVEKTIPGGQRLSPIIGVVLVLLAAMWLIQPASGLWSAGR
jgi:predicted metal-binding membrane protein